MLMLFIFKNKMEIFSESICLTFSLYSYIILVIREQQTYANKRENRVRVYNGGPQFMFVFTLTNLNKRENANNKINNHDKKIK